MARVSVLIAALGRFHQLRHGRGALEQWCALGTGRSIAELIERVSEGLIVRRVRRFVNETTARRTAAQISAKQTHFRVSCTYGTHEVKVPYLAKSRALLNVRWMVVMTGADTVFSGSGTMGL